MSIYVRPSVEVQGKQGNDIIEGNFVHIKLRGGSHQGKAETTKDQASARHKGVVSYPKGSPTSARQCFSIFF
ncbi:uncharacterized protein N7479_010844 [Penicillium vulpinum]|uniref:uncharacterized protein n=1 Tax=Penicillium vulpinum TaxID=29845 RepID=UPI002546B874|nr:uncharacterized protein N7479_010844 [Penicillium vulpinum]KAJ5952431.1 hypothetical protein N7479_010844 [Penicillium vulpinum]